MNSSQLKEFIETRDEILTCWNGGSSKKEQILARTVKLNEEVGELCGEILGYHKDQRKEKIDKYNDETLGDEFADVLITTLLLAKFVGIDIYQALINKMEKINKRYDRTEVA